MLILSLLALTSCTALREGETLHFGDKSVRAFGLIPRGGLEAELKVDHLDIDLYNSPPFVINFSDGYQARSSEITASLLKQHSLPVASEGNLQSATWREPDALGWYVGRHWYAMFVVGNDGSAKSLHMSACGHEKPNVLASVDGAKKYGFPIAKGELQELFGLPASTSKTDVIWAFSCP